MIKSWLTRGLARYARKLEVPPSLALRYYSQNKFFIQQRSFGGDTGVHF